MTEENTEMVSLVELKTEVAAFDATSVQTAKAKLEAFLNQFGNGEHCQICGHRKTDCARLFDEHRVFAHDDLLDHRFTNKQIKLPLPFTAFISDVKIYTYDNSIRFQRVIWKKKSMDRHISNGADLTARDVKDTEYMDLNDLVNLRDVLMYLPHFIEMYKDYLKENKVKIDNILENIKFS